MRDRASKAVKLSVPASRSRLVFRASHRSLEASGGRTVAPFRAAVRRGFPVAGFQPKAAPAPSHDAVERDAELDVENARRGPQRRGRGARRRNRR